MDKEDILKRSRREKDEGLTYAQDRGRQYGVVGFLVLFLVIMIYNMVRGLDNSLPLTLFWAYLSCEAAGRYLPGRKRACWPPQCWPDWPPSSPWSPTSWRPCREPGQTAGAGQAGTDVCAAVRPFPAGPAGGNAAAAGTGAGARPMRKERSMIHEQGRDPGEKPQRKRPSGRDGAHCPHRGESFSLILVFLVGGSDRDLQPAPRPARQQCAGHVLGPPVGNRLYRLTKRRNTSDVVTLLISLAFLAWNLVRYFTQGW